LKKWLRHAETLSDPEEEQVFILNQKLEKTSAMRRRDQGEIS
jgi:hypothetical protein